MQDEQVDEPGAKKYGDIEGKTEVQLSSKPHNNWDVEYAPPTMDSCYTFSNNEYCTSSGQDDVDNTHVGVQSTRPSHPLSQEEVKSFIAKFPNKCNFSPSLLAIINFPKSSNAFTKKKSEITKEKLCVMCGLPNIGEGGCFIRRQNKGVCTNCDSGFWIHKSTGCLIKWCKGCKNFLYASKFGRKTCASKCESCRIRVRAAYTKKKSKPSRSEAPGKKCPRCFSNYKVCHPEPLVPDSHGKGRARVLNPVKTSAEYNLPSYRDDTSSPIVLSRPLASTIREAIAAMTAYQSTATTNDSCKKRPMITISSGESGSHKGDTAPQPSTLHQLAAELKRRRTRNQLLSNDAQSCTPSSNNNGAFGKAAELKQKDIVHDSMYLNGHAMQRPSSKLVTNPSTNELMSIIEDHESQSTSLKTPFDRIGFLVSLLGEEGSSESQDNKANGGAPPLTVTHQSPTIYFDPGVGGQWAKKKICSPSHFLEAKHQMAFVKTSMNARECPSPLSNISHHVPVHSV